MHLEGEGGSNLCTSRKGAGGDNSMLLKAAGRSIVWISRDAAGGDKYLIDSAGVRCTG